MFGFSPIRKVPAKLAKITSRLISRSGLAFHFASSILNGFDDMLIAGAAAQIAFQSVPYLGFCWICVAVEDLCGGHHHSGCAIPTLQAVPLPKSFLNRMQ